MVATLGDGLSRPCCLRYAVCPNFQPAVDEADPFLARTAYFRWHLCLDFRLDTSCFGLDCEATSKRVCRILTTPPSGHDRSNGLFRHVGISSAGPWGQNEASWPLELPRTPILVLATSQPVPALPLVHIIWLSGILSRAYLDKFSTQCSGDKTSMEETLAVGRPVAKTNAIEPRTVVAERQSS